MGIEAIIFDFDGLVLETEMPVYTAWKEIYAEHGHPLPIEDWIDCLGRSSEYSDFHGRLEKLVGRELDRGSIRVRREAAARAKIDADPLLPGVIDWLDEAAELGLRRAVASGSSHRWVEGHLAQRGLLDRFEHVVCAEDTERHKPHPDPFLKAAELLGVEPASCLVLEDSPNGITAAKAAGMRCIAVPSQITRPLDLSHADQRVESLEELSLREAVDRLGG
jgi:HAD superfamily hydrolase (TIGR01509 family)